MYWPAGPPRIYSASGQVPAAESVLTSDDDAPSASQTQSSVDDEAHNLQIEPDLLTSPNGSRDGELLSPALGEGAATDSPTTERAAGAESRRSDADAILALCVSRSGHLFATITRTTLTIWQTKPTAVLAAVVRSSASLATYGPNVSLLIRPDSAIFVIQTSRRYLVTYSLAADGEARVYRARFAEAANGRHRQHALAGGERALCGPGEGGGVREVSVRFRMVIRLDAGISQALALDDELVVATEKPGAVQCIRWTPDSTGKQTSTELLSRMGWIGRRTTVVEMVHDRPMNLSAWIAADGSAYAVQRLSGSGGAAEDGQASTRLFRGYGFHAPTERSSFAVKAAINARFSLLAVACVDGSVRVYNARDYAGNIPLSHQHRPAVSSATAGRVTVLCYSPDGHCLFAGFERGWAMWSVYGKSLGQSFSADGGLAERDGEAWLQGVRGASWLAGGGELLLVGVDDARLWLLELARSAVTTCYSTANMARSLLQTNTSVMIHRGYGLSDLTTISAEAALWQQVQVPASYLRDQWPLKSAVISADGRYVAVAGRRGLAHYSVHSGRWKVFDDERQANEFTIRGGMCWHRHILVAAVECGSESELRLYSRELALDRSLVLHVESMSSPIVHLAPSGEDSLLVYTHENILFHYVVAADESSVRLVLVGQIAFHGIVRAPARVRAMSWVLPENQMLEGDPSRDVAVASVFFLVDGKLVLLQPSKAESGELRYDMKILAQNVEYFVLMRDQVPSALRPTARSDEAARSEGPAVEAHDGVAAPAQALSDSLWLFDGREMRLWTEVQDVIRPAGGGTAREMAPSIANSMDFYPLSILLDKGILLGVEAELVQRRDVNFASFRLGLRTHLFLPAILRHHLARFDPSAALHLAHHYRGLQYFPHALEVLLHDVLDEDVDRSPSAEVALLPKVLSFLSSFPDYLDVVVQCTRKTEVRSWRTLFAYLPAPQELFEESLQRGQLKTAGGYLLVLHTLQEIGSGSQQVVRLLRRARDAQEWELCKELARFLMALDESGDTLRTVLEMVDSPHRRHGLETEDSSHGRHALADGPAAEAKLSLTVPRRPNGLGLDGVDDGLSPGSVSPGSVSAGSMSAGSASPVLSTAENGHVQEYQ